MQQTGRGVGVKTNYHEQVDGFFGQATAVAIERFQIDDDLYVKGVIDRQLLLTLGIIKY